MGSCSKRARFPSTLPSLLLPLTLPVLVLDASSSTGPAHTVSSPGSAHILHLSGLRHPGQTASFLFCPLVSIGYLESPLPGHFAFVCTVMSCFSIPFPKMASWTDVGLLSWTQNIQSIRPPQKRRNSVWQVLASHFTKGAPLHQRKTDGKPRMDDTGRSGFAQMPHARLSSMWSHPI